MRVCEKFDHTAKKTSLPWAKTFYWKTIVFFYQIHVFLLRKNIFKLSDYAIIWSMETQLLLKILFFLTLLYKDTIRMLKKLLKTSWFRAKITTFISSSCPTREFLGQKSVSWLRSDFFNSRCDYQDERITSCGPTLSPSKQTDLWGPIMQRGLKASEWIYNEAFYGSLWGLWWENSKPIFVFSLIKCWVFADVWCDVVYSDTLLFSLHLGLFSPSDTFQPAALSVAAQTAAWSSALQKPQAGWLRLRWSERHKNPERDKSHRATHLQREPAASQTQTPASEMVENPKWRPWLRFERDMTIRRCNYMCSNALWIMLARGCTELL